jgi:spore germination protein YaaH
MKCLGWLALFTSMVAAAQKPSTPKALFYMTETPASVNSFLEHASRIDILVPAWYHLDADGLVTGGPDPRVLDAAREHHVPVMPIVALFNKVAIHTFFLNSKAHQTMIDALIRESKEHGYTGFQLDFEDVEWTDRDQLSAVVKETADALHGQGLQLSIATVPNAPGHPGSGGFSKWIWTDWRGAYDLKAIAQSVDLLCLMTYDQHTRWTTPGPVGGWGWTTENLTYALQFVPREKLSLGIALYGYHWYTGEPTEQPLVPPNQNPVYKPNYVGEYISEPNSMFYAHTYGATPQWDPVDRTAWFWFERDQMREWIFFTDQRTFEERYRLVENENLQGFCSWVLGEEDPGVWKLLPEHK